MKWLNPLFFIEFVTCSISGGDSSSSSSNSTSTTNIDKRQVVDTGGIGVSSDSSTVTVTNNSLDAGIVNTALDVVKANDATNGASFTQLLNMADKMFTNSAAMIAKAQDTTLSQVGTLTTLANDQKGAVDQKTLIILAVAGVGLMSLKGKR